MLKCLFGHKYEKTTRHMLGLVDGRLTPFESPTSRCAKCGKFQDEERERMLANMAAYGQIPTEST